MKKYTIEQVLTMTNVKFRTTPEQALAFRIAFDKKFKIKTNLKYSDSITAMYIDYQGKLSKSCWDNTFFEAVETEVELVDTAKFNTQQEIFNYLLIEGNKIISDDDNGNIIVYFNETGMLNHSYLFAYPKIWKPYIEPKNWYEIDNKFTMCKVSDTEDFSSFSYTPVKYIFEDKNFVDMEGLIWHYAEPTTIVEIEQYF